MSLTYDLGLKGHVHLVSSVPDQDLSLFYSAADLYVQPSLHEGFGIPCLEAVACETPVLATRGGALREVVGDAGWIVDDPFDDSALSEGMDHMLYDPHLRADMIRRSLERVLEFSWGRAAQRQLDVNQSALEGC
jgi:glycosyltransferase involved in cell wall biosynthesis